MKKIQNSISRFALFLTLIFSFNLTGCVYLVVGTVGVVGGYVVSPDTVEGLTSKDQNKVWNAAVEIATIMGRVEDKMQSAGVIVAKVQGAKVTITVLPISEANVKLTVKARKALLPKINVAQDVFTKIMRDFPARRTYSLTLFPSEVNL